MIVRSVGALAATVGLGLVLSEIHFTFAQEPARLGALASPALTTPPPLSVQQQLANTIAQHLRDSGQLRRYRIDVSVENGLVELTGEVADQTQREVALRIVQGVPGVVRVRDRLTLPKALALAQASDQPVLIEPAPLVRKEGDAAVGPNSRPPEPTPIFQAPPPWQGGMQPGPSGGQQPPPPLPPYAWPTYAPYNNYSRVAYPTQYPYQSWPFIGPMHPFPKVPLGWRSITLEYLDGHWWYGRNSNGHDWWRVRYW